MPITRPASGRRARADPALGVPGGAPPEPAAALPAEPAGTGVTRIAGVAPGSAPAGSAGLECSPGPAVDGSPGWLAAVVLQPAAANAVLTSTGASTTQQTRGQLRISVTLAVPWCARGPDSRFHPQSRPRCAPTAGGRARRSRPDSA